MVDAEGVKWKLRYSYFCAVKMNFRSLGQGITNQK